MIEFENGGRLVQDLSELPNLQNSKNLFCDFETTSFDPKVPALLPHKGHKIAGICITADEHPGAWYVPIRCRWEKWNLPLENTIKWLKDTIETCDDWVNHNVKFDAHFARYEGIEFKGRLIDTIVLSKIIDSDRFNYGLKPLSLDWLEYDPGPAEDAVKTFLGGIKSKNYGDVPADIIGEYGCQDVITNRLLYENLLRRRSERVTGVWNTEILLTPVLFDMEVGGMRVDPTQLKIKEYKILTQMLKLDEELHKLLGFAIRANTNADCHEALCGHFGLPILGWTEKGDPSFDKHALTAYLSHPIVANSEKLKTIVEKIKEYRHIYTLLSFFVRPYQEHEVDGVLHPDYNQTVRTGRMSCRRPNAQQLSKEAKELILPFDGQTFVSYDYDQVEFRLIVHYLQNVRAMQSYEDDPDTDFHNWVAKMCEIPRDPAKNINFAIAFGGGKKKIVSMLASNVELVGNLSEKVDTLIKNGTITDENRQAMFNVLCKRRGEAVYNEYHETLPELRKKSSAAAKALALRGYVINAYGRERRLPEKIKYAAFNTVIQSTAADLMKERTVAIAPRYNKKIRDLEITMCASVHDNPLLNFPNEVAEDYGNLRYIRDILESPSVQFRVPIRTSCGISNKNWKIASGKEGEIDLQRPE